MAILPQTKGLTMNDQAAKALQTFGEFCIAQYGESGFITVRKEPELKSIMQGTVFSFFNADLKYVQTEYKLIVHEGWIYFTSMLEGIETILLSAVFGYNI